MKVDPNPAPNVRRRPPAPPATFRDNCLLVLAAMLFVASMIAVIVEVFPQPRRHAVNTAARVLQNVRPALLRRYLRRLFAAGGAVREGRSRQIRHVLWNGIDRRHTPESLARVVADRATGFGWTLTVYLPKHK